MQNKTNHINNLFHNGHLTEEGIALWADALVELTENDLPQELKGHVDKCLDCKKEILELYDDLKEVDRPDKDQEIEKGKVSKVNWKVYYRYAAIIILLISVTAIIYFTTRTKPDNQQLFTEYFKPYPNVIITKGLNEELLSVGMYYYDMSKYDSAIIFYNKILANKSTNTEVLFYKGVCFLSINKTEEAIEIFSDIVSGKETPYKSPTEWYLALSYLKMQDVRKAKEILTLIRNRDSYYNQSLEELLEKLD